MRYSTHPALVATIIRDSGIIAADAPSVHSPIAVNLFYWYNPDGSIRCIWPKGSQQPDFSTLFPVLQLKNKWMTKVHRLLFALGFGSALSHGKTVLYMDVPTATYLQSQWRMNPLPSRN